MKSIGPHINRDFGGQDRPRALFSKLPLGVDAFCDFHVFVDDFVGTLDTNKWATVKDTGAAAAVSADAENGVVALTSTATTDNDGALIQAVETNFLLVSGKELWFEARVKVSDADQCDMFIGLADTAATDPEAVIAAGLARVGFELRDGSASIVAVVDNDTATTDVSTGKSMSDDTYVRLGFRTDGGHVRFYVNRALVGTTSIPTAIAAVTLGPAFYGLSGNATGTHTRHCDYVVAAQER